MIPDELLKLVRSRGVSVWAAAPDRLRCRCRGPLPDDLRQLVLEHKAGLLALLPPPWDQARPTSWSARPRPPWTGPRRRAGTAG
jgi:hypothetical protein